MKNVRNIFLFIVKIAAIFAAASILTSILACYINPQKYWIFQLFGLFFNAIFISNIILVVILRLSKSRIAYINFAVIIISLLYIGRFFQLSGSKASNDCEILKIITYNVHEFINIDNHRQATHEEITAFLLNENADIICMQEYSETRGMTNKNLQKLCQNYQYSYGAYGGQKIFSKYPFANKQYVNFAGSTVVFADININGKIVRAYSCHLQSTNFNPDNTQQRLSASNANYERELKRVVVNLRSAFKKRAAQVELIAKNIAESPYPAIVCGDFNDTPMSYSYQKIRGKMSDTFIEAGAGIPHTYKKLFSLLRIDYVFTHETITPVEYSVANNIKCSDHYPVVVKFKI
jgi:endonuclease/exonuclease/phosphatase family metal-dependent hydrolase